MAHCSIVLGTNFVVSATAATGAGLRRRGKDERSKVVETTAMLASAATQMAILLARRNIRVRALRQVVEVAAFSFLEGRV